MQQGHQFLVVLSVMLITLFSTHALEECRSFMASECEEPQKCSIITNDTMVCCVIDGFKVKETLGALNHNGIKYLHLFNATVSDLVLYSYKHLESLSITNGNITQITMKGDLNNVKCLNFSDNNLSRLIQKGNLPKLKILDLSKNNLTNLPVKLNPAVQSLTLDIQGNNQLMCTYIREFVNEQKKTKTIEFRNKNDTKCSVNKSFEWFNTTEYISLSYLEDVAEPEAQCQQLEGLENCHCKLDRMWFTTQQLLQTVDVDCSNSQLKSLPPRLPPNTVILNVSYNNITNLDQMKDSSYSSVRRLSADNNHISSITVLEGTSFISNFSMLSLRNNNLTSIPTYILSNSFDRNYVSSAVLLGGNKLICDCNTAQVLKGWLLSNKKFIYDYDDVACRNYPKRVMELEQQDVCVIQRSWTDYIYYIIAGEVALFIFLFSKVSYDYWVFKTAGYLPWPASKMPKLPCDCFFES